MWVEKRNRRRWQRHNPRFIPPESHRENGIITDIVEEWLGSPTHSGLNPLRLLILRSAAFLWIGTRLRWQTRYGCVFLSMLASSIPSPLRNIGGANGSRRSRSAPGPQSPGIMQTRNKFPNPAGIATATQKTPSPDDEQKMPPRGRLNGDGRTGRSLQGCTR